MPKIKKILLPVDVPIASLSVIHQAATLARHFHSEILMLHVATALSYAAGVPQSEHELANWDLLDEVIREAQKHHDAALGSNLQGLSIQRQVVKGETATEITRTSRAAKADLIMLPAHGFTFSQFLIGPAREEGSHEAECPVWTGAQRETPAVHPFAIRNVLCAVEFGVRCDIAVSWAVQMATEFGAHVTLATVTPGVEYWGPGGTSSNPKWKEELQGNASEQMAKLQKSAGVKADVFIGSGDAPKVLCQAVKKTHADLLVAGCYPYGGYLRTHGYGIMCAVQIPVLSV